MQCRWDVDAMQMGRGWHELHQSAPFLWFLRADRRSSVSLDNTKQVCHSYACFHHLCRQNLWIQNYELFVWCCRTGRSTSYWELRLGAKKSYDIVVQYHNSVFFVRKSGWLDSNQRPHAPQTCTLTNCATSRCSVKAVQRYTQCAIYAN